MVSIGNNYLRLKRSELVLFGAEVLRGRAILIISSM